MLNHTYTSVKNANLVDCGKKQHIPSQPSTLLRDNYLGEYRTELDKKKVLANLGIATDLSLEWEYIKGDIGRSEALMSELDSRTKYISEIDGFQKTIIEGIKWLEGVVGGEEEGEEEQNQRLSALETTTDELIVDLEEVKEYLTETIEVDINKLKTDLESITEKVNNITNLIQVSTKEGNALTLEEGDTPGLYVPDLSTEVNAAAENIEQIKEDISGIKSDLDNFVTKEELGGDGFEFVNQSDYDAFVNSTSGALSNIREELKNTVKTGEDGHVDTLYVNKISKNNDDGNIIITDSFETEDGIPLDIRFVRENLEELYKLPVKVCYPGMGVVVNSLSSLYILRKPAEGIEFNQDYISNPNNWKCPEDLVTVALTRTEYENLEEVNPNVFYYVYEDEITRTQEPKRDEYLTEEEFQVEWQKWVESLKTLSQEYMSASWGVDIENKLAKKASSQSVSILMEELANIKGNGNTPSLESLHTSVTELQNTDTTLKERIDEILIRHSDVEQGRLVTVEKDVAKVKTDLGDYVTKSYIQDSSNNFIFVKTADYQKDQSDFKEALAEKVTTKEVETTSINLGDSVLTVEEAKLQCDSVPIATILDVPNIKVIPQEEYDNLPEKDEDTYYYTFDGDNIYVTKSELSKEYNKLQQQINVLFQGGTAEDIEGTLETIFLPIEVWNNFIENYQRTAALVEDLQNRLLVLEPIKVVVTEDGNIYISGDSARCYHYEDTVYIESESITY